jgi:hypothetical protein
MIKTCVVEVKHSNLALQAHLKIICNTIDFIRIKFFFQVGDVHLNLFKVWSSHSFFQIKKGSLFPYFLGITPPLRLTISLAR